jgi:hypothetical protein
MCKYKIRARLTNTVYDSNMLVPSLECCYSYLYKMCESSKRWIATLILQIQRTVCYMITLTYGSLLVTENELLHTNVVF